VWYPFLPGKADDEFVKRAKVRRVDMQHTGLKMACEMIAY
jgi:hypothetical protein